MSAKPLDRMTARGLMQALNNAQWREERAREKLRNATHGTPDWLTADSRFVAAFNHRRTVEAEIAFRLRERDGLLAKRGAGGTR